MTPKTEQVPNPGYTYWEHVTNAASVEAYRRDDEGDTLISAEALPENSSLMGFKAFARDYPEKLFPLLYKLRPEFQELFIEFYILEKSQYFIAKAHGQIQTRVWQNLRVIEQAIGALILLGSTPDATILQPILQKAGLETTEYGSLTSMILLYVTSQNYALVAKAVGAPAPAIRKIFRPAIATLLADKNVKAVAVGAYLRSLTHQASLTDAGLSERCKARTQRVKDLHFIAPPLEDSPLLSFGPVNNLKDTPWCMFEISSEHRMNQILPLLQAHAKKMFGKKPVQIFAPMNAEGELEFTYLFARSTSMALVRSLTKVRGISEMSAIYHEDGSFKQAVTIPNADVQTMVSKHPAPVAAEVKVKDFVEILTGEAARYCGTVIRANKRTGQLVVEVQFPTGRHFVICGDSSCVKVIPEVPAERRGFWGEKVIEVAGPPKS